MKLEKFLEKFAALKSKIWDLISPYYEKAISILKSEQFLIYLVTLPLFGNWLIGLTFYSDRKEVIFYSKLSFLNTIYFLSILALSLPISWIPLVGVWLANLVHLSAICLYLGLSGFLLYNYAKGKKLVPKLPAEHLALLEKKLF
ncbi:hypothetical protein CH373_00295 [Leptospira perolatii]|uniref:DUF4870 domain-containing protein n=1 Tax=Leptospira perolatii TaxID=2023191 RepID=A0A2M9ZR58_9LEPT|nr:hypothetical protein [Leptospira perolatii]PJZ71010.1 hypothetical protein CH360_00295 [Leptospira perolatii]PJZ74542.1 hypothetical protein CH373_00295 [Leptospira perolatii]